MTWKACRVTVVNASNEAATALVTASSIYEAAVMGVCAVRAKGWEHIGRYDDDRVRVEILEPRPPREVAIAQVYAWLEPRDAATPDLALRKTLMLQQLGPRQTRPDATADGRPPWHPFRLPRSPL